MENIALDKEFNEVKLSVPAVDDQKGDEGAIKPTETQTQLPEKGVINKAMHYEAAMTSPTELLAPEVFPDEITDMNGNALPDKSKISFHQQRSTRRCLVWFLIFFVATTLVMTALFTWKMIDEPTVESQHQERTCYVKVKPKRFKSIPTTILEYMDSWKAVIRKEMKKIRQSLVLVNVVYYDKVIWETKLRWNSTTMETTSETSDKLFPAASVTKVITALLAYKLYNDKAIGLDDSIVKYEPDFWVRNPFKNDNGSGITIRQLITYSSGLPREGPCYQESTDSYCPHNNSYIMQQLRKNTTRLLFPPGSDALYGNLPFALAGNAISNTNDDGFEGYVHDKLFKPLKMTSSAFSINDINRIYSPGDVNGKVPRFKHWGWLNPAGGLLTTLHDLAQLEIGLFNNSKTEFLKSAILDEFFMPAHFFADERQMVGNAWDIGFHKGYLNYSKEGYVYGYGSMILLLPELRIAVNVLSTSNEAYDSFKPKIPKLYDLFHKELAKLPQTRQKNSVPNPERFIGEYFTDQVITLHEVPMRISIDKEHRYLSLQFSKYEFPLTYIGDYVFEIIHENLCMDFSLGINGERMYFTKPKNPKSKVDEFVIYGVNLQGMTTFRRKNLKNK